MLNNYISSLLKTFKRGDAREESYYNILSDFMIEYSKIHRQKKIDVTILPKKTEAGNPDFRVWDGRQKIIGYIEAKDLGTDLDKVEDSNQLERYISTFPNVILTNFTEFRLYRNSEIIYKVSIASPFVIRKLGTIPPLENEHDFHEFVNRFLDFSLPRTFTAKTLAVELAKRTKFLKDEIVTEELKKGTTSIHGFYDAFKEFLIAGIKEDEFADLYSQTITYGLFAARLRADKEFNRRLAFDYIPKSIGILRDVFRFISIEEIPQQMEVIIDDISEVLSCADAKSLLDKYYHEGKGKDPVLHFYETFLAEYDPATREKRGVYYTPEPVVSFIVRSLHEILKNSFGLSDGLASKNVTLLDPAGGTLGFIYQTIEIAVKEIKEKYGEGAVKAFLMERVLPNFYSFELMMAPYAIGHMKISFLMEELGYKMKDDERVKYYLTNTLEMKELEESKFPGMSSLSHESHEAGKVKRDNPILVVLGNPPYSGHSANKGTWISDEIKEYYMVDGEPLGEKNPKWLQDDYVKFIRFSQWKIDQAGEGVLGFITNHSYLDNATFRGMRQSLMNSFDEIYILDLHGNSLKKEKTPDGGKDENVFDIKQGVAIALFVKKKIRTNRSPIQIKTPAKVYHSELFGLREAKYEWLNKHKLTHKNFKQLLPDSPWYFFIPRDIEKISGYLKWEKINVIYPINSVGIVTARDKFVIEFEKAKLERRIRMFIDKNESDELISETFNLKDKMNWKLKMQREKLINDEAWKDYFTKILYRPFDERFIYYYDSLIERSRKDVMRHMLSDNLAIVTRRQMLPGKPCNYFFVTNLIIADGVIRSDNKGSESLFPLYLYSEREKKKKIRTQLVMFEPEENYFTKQPNISEDVFKKLKNFYKKEPMPEQIFYYTYAILYSNTYRTKYAEFLKIDFPRIPFTKDYKLFIKLGKLGKQIADLHLLKSKELNRTKSKISGKGNNKVTFKPKYENERVYINADQYFTNVTKEVWNYQIGGYQVCEKWLKDRKKRTLTIDEITIYCKIISALSKTIEIQNEIDKNYDGVE
jgi:predicted helicase